MERRIGDAPHATLRHAASDERHLARGHRAHRVAAGRADEMAELKKAAAGLVTFAQALWAALCDKYSVDVKPDPAKVLAAWDKNGDGSVTKMEFRQVCCGWRAF